MRLEVVASEVQGSSFNSLPPSLLPSFPPSLSSPLFQCFLDHALGFRSRRLRTLQMTKFLGHFDRRSVGLAPHFEHS